MQTRTRTLLFVLCLLFSGSLLAQQAPKPSPLETTGTSAPATGAAAPSAIPQSAIRTPQSEDEIVQLSVFNVSGDKDEGYAAANTTSGSRINTPLKDVAASISPFTEEFLNDIGAASLDDILAYAGNVEAELEDSSAAFNFNNTRQAGNNYNLFRIRGIAGTTLVDGAETTIPFDHYNIARTEMASGANSILFGMGAQGGVLALTTKRANLQRNTLSIKNIIATSNNIRNPWNYERALLDYNVVLRPRTMAFRLNAVYQNAGTWRYREFNDSTRINPAFAAKPFKNTTIYASYEGGLVRNATSRPFNIVDGITLWDQAKRPVMAGFGAANEVAGTQLINDTATTNYLVYVNNNDTLYNFRQAYTSSNISLDDGGSTFLPPSVSPFAYSTVGPGGVRKQKITSWSFVVDQRLGNLDLELSVLYNKNDSTALSPGNVRATMRGDPNLLISPPAWAGSAIANLVSNPYAGWIYAESTWIKDYRCQANTLYRLTGQYTLDLKKYGRHNIIGDVEHLESELIRFRKSCILVDDNQVAINNAASPEAVGNQINSRQYFTEGDFTTYYDGAAPPNITGLVIGDRTFHTTWVNQVRVAAHIKKSINSFMLALQSHTFRNRLSTIFGLRLDDVTFKQEWPQQRISDPDDPRILNKSLVLNENYFVGTWRRGGFRPYTFTAGGVYHLGERIAPFVNFSTNRGLPELDGRTVLPKGYFPGLTVGRTVDCGVMFDFFGNNKLTARLVRFDSMQLHDPAITPNNITTANSSALGSDNLFNIFDALYFLYPTKLTGAPPAGGWPAGTGVIPGTNIGLGPMPASMYAVSPPSAGYPYGAPPAYNAGMVDTHASGFELEITGKPTKNTDIRFTLSYTDRNRTNIFQEIVDYYNANIPVWMQLANSGNYTVNQMHLPDYIWDQIYGPGGVRESLANQLSIQTGPLGARPWKTNLTIRYTFPKGSYFKGVALMLSGRYQSANLMPDPNRATVGLGPTPPHTDTKFAFDPNKFYENATMLRGDSYVFFDGMASYRRKLFGGRTTMTIQLNILNLFNKNEPGVGRLNANGTPSRYYLPSPRSIRLTTQLDF